MADLGNVEIVVLTRKAYDEIVKDVADLAVDVRELLATRDEMLSSLPSGAMRELMDAAKEMYPRGDDGAQVRELCDKIEAWLDVWEVQEPKDNPE